MMWDWCGIDKKDEDDMPPWDVQEFPRTSEKVDYTRDI